MCHLSMKLSDTFDQNPPSTFDKILEKPIPMKNSHSLTLRAKVKKEQKSKANALGNKKYASQRKFEQGFP